MARALIVEDGAEIGAFLAQAVRECVGASDLARNLSDARRFLKEGEYSLLLLDLGLPDGSGAVLLEELRAAGRTMPVIVLSGRGEVDNRVRCLDIGADDFVCKPFILSELISRIRAVLRRAEGRATSRLVLGDVELDEAARRVTVQGRLVDLTPREFDVLRTLLRSPGTVMARTQIVNAVWSWSFDGYSNVVDVHVCALRKKLTGGGIDFRAVPRVGYSVEVAANSVRSGQADPASASGE